MMQDSWTIGQILGFIGRSIEKFMVFGVPALCIPGFFLAIEVL